MTYKFSDILAGDEVLVRFKVGDVGPCSIKSATNGSYTFDQVEKVFPVAPRFQAGDIVAISEKPSEHHYRVIATHGPIAFIVANSATDAYPFLESNDALSLVKREEAPSEPKAIETSEAEPHLSLTAAIALRNSEPGNLRAPDFSAKYPFPLEARVFNQDTDCWGRVTMFGPKCWHVEYDSGQTERHLYTESLNWLINIAVSGDAPFLPGDRVMIDKRHEAFVICVGSEISVIFALNPRPKTILVANYRITPALSDDAD